MEDKQERQFVVPQALAGHRLAYHVQANWPHVCGCSCNQPIYKGESCYQVLQIERCGNKFLAFIKDECFEKYKEVKISGNDANQTSQGT